MPITTVSPKINSELNDLKEIKKKVDKKTKKVLPSEESDSSNTATEKGALIDKRV